jgi:hypothetical protein
MQTVLYADPREDITLDIVRILNEGHEQTEPESSSGTEEQ